MNKQYRVCYFGSRIPYMHLETHTEQISFIPLSSIVIGYRRQIGVISRTMYTKMSDPKSADILRVCTVVTLER